MQFLSCLALQVLEAVKGQTKPVAAPELLECMKILMTTIKPFLKLVLATRDKDGLLWSAWVANEQTQEIIKSKKEVNITDRYLAKQSLFQTNITSDCFKSIYICNLFSSQINAANEKFKTAAFRYSFEVDLYKI